MDSKTVSSDEKLNLILFMSDFYLYFLNLFCFKLIYQLNGSLWWLVLFFYFLFQIIYQQFYFCLSKNLLFWTLLVFLKFNGINISYHFPIIGLSSNISNLYSLNFSEDESSIFYLPSFHLYCYPHFHNIPFFIWFKINSFLY